MKTARAANIFYWSHLNVIGGVETWLFEIAKKYGKTHDIMVVYDTFDKVQRERLRPLVRTVQNNGQKFVCDRCFVGLGGQKLFPQLEAKEIYQVLHADYKAQNIPWIEDERITGYIGVSQNTCDTFKEISGHEAQLCYNPLEKRKPRKVLHLISPTRLSSQKSPHRFIAFAEALEKEGVPYVWDIYSDGRIPNYFNDNISYHPPKLDIIDYIADADYLVQLSESEGYPYTIIEALSVGTPVIVTDLPCLKDCKVADRKNGFVLPFDMSNIPVKEIYKGLPKFTYTINKDRWDELLAKGDSTYEAYLNTPVRIKTLKIYYDIPLERELKVGEEQTVARTRADYLIELGLAEEIENDAVPV